MAGRKRTHKSTPTMKFFFILFFLPLLFIIPSVSAVNWSIGDITLKDDNYDSTPFIKGSNIKSITVQLINETGNNSELDNFSVVSALISNDEDVLIERNLSYIGDGKYRYTASDIYTFTGAGDWNVGVEATDGDDNTLSKTDSFKVRNPVSLTLFIIIGVISLLTLIMGFSGNLTLGSIGVGLLLIIGIIILQGQLAFPDGEVETTIGDTKVVETSYNNWNYGDYELVGKLLIFTSIGLFILMLMKET